MPKQRKQKTPRNVIAQDLWTPKYRTKVEAQRKGAKSYDRKRRPDSRQDGVSIFRSSARR